MIINKIISIIVLCSITLGVVSQATDATLTVTVAGFESDQGMLMIALFNSKKTYDTEKDDFKPYRADSARIISKQSIYVFEDLPYGEYAIKIFHDKNDNQKLDKNFIGIPKEDYGFSNNPKADFGPANYDEARFEVNNNNKHLLIQLNN
jgi:uncharacterized protein (DUF2141 family)